MTKPIDLESAMHIRDANESLGDVVDMMNEMSDEQLFELHRKEMQELYKDDPTITLAQNPNDMDSKNIYLRMPISDKLPNTYTIVGLHAVGHAEPYEYDMHHLDGRVERIKTNFMALETWGNEYDDEHNMLGRGSFRLHTNDIEGYAKDMVSEGWEIYEGPKRKNS